MHALSAFNTLKLLKYKNILPFQPIFFTYSKTKHVMKLTRCLLFAGLFLPVVLFGQNTQPLSTNSESDFAFFVKTLEKRSPLLQKMYASTTHAKNLSADEAKELVEKKLKELNDKELSNTYAKLSNDQMVKIGFVLYLLMNGLSNTTDYPGYDYKSKFGGGIGVFLMYTMSKLILMPELAVMWRSYGEEGGGSEYKVHFTYLSLAVTVLYVIEATALKFVVGVAPSLGYALGGKVKYNGHSESIEFGDNGAKRINAGIGLTAGILLQRDMMLRLIYNFGLSKLYDGDKAKTYFYGLVFSMPLWPR